MESKTSSFTPVMSGLLLLSAVFIGVLSFRSCQNDKALNELNKEKANLIMQLDSLQLLLDEAATTGKSKGTNAPPMLAGSDIPPTGTYFDVQIGAFEFFDLNPYRKGFTNLKEERDEEMDKYTIARFRTYPDAELFKRDIIRLGIHDAWIVGKIDGKRTDIKTAIQSSK